MNRFSKIISIIFLLFFLSIPLLHAEEPLKDPFYTQGQAILNAPPVHSVAENVDLFSGNLQIAHTDAYFPGNGGLDLKIMRVYNSAIWGRRDVPSPGLIAWNERSPLGIGWTMHMGIVRNPFATGGGNEYFGDNPIVEMPDGSQHVLYRDKTDTTRFISKEYWIYKQIDTNGTWELTLTDGTVYTFRYNPEGPGYVTNDGKTIAQATSIRTAAGNVNAEIHINYTRPAGNTYSYLTSISIMDSVPRNIVFHYDYATHRLTSIYLDDNKLLMSYAYEQVINGSSYLTKAMLPAGNPWQYSYNTTNYELQTMTYPAGGTITYGYNDIPFSVAARNSVPNPLVSFGVVTSRTTNNNSGVVGNWSYQYVTAGETTAFNTTTVTAPDGVKEIHKFLGWNYCTSNRVYSVGLPLSKEFKRYNSETLADETFYFEINYWQPSASISIQSISNAGWNNNTPTATDAGVYVPQLWQKTVVLDGDINWINEEPDSNGKVSFSTNGQMYDTIYNSYDDYGNPTSISENSYDWDAFKTPGRYTTIYYDYNTDKNMVVSRPHLIRVKGEGETAETFETTNAYDSGTGQLMQVNKYGVTTDFTYDSSTGNLASVKDANGNTTYYAWNYGRIWKKTNPVYFVSRVVERDGTITSETNGRNDTTSYGYDGNFRLTSITPPLGSNPTTFTYDLNGTYKKTTRDLYESYTYYDGFGRPVRTIDSKGIETNTVYTAYGPVNYTTSNIGDTTYSDLLGRPVQIEHRDGSTIDYSYSGSYKGISDEEDNWTKLVYHAFGDPNEERLVSVNKEPLPGEIEQYANVTTYEYNILGSLTSITQHLDPADPQNVLTRTFHYNSKNQLEWETHPEKGTIAYTRYNIGTIETKMDGLGTTTYTYDYINRLRTVSNASGSIDFEYDNADNRTHVNNAVTLITYTYDENNRLTDKNETVGSAGYTTHYDYDGNDNLTGITYPSSRRVTYGHNSYSQVTSVDWPEGRVSQIDYYTPSDNTPAIGLPKQYRYSNGHTVSFTYNSRNLATDIVGGATGQGGVDMFYDYDPRGNTTAIIDRATGGTSLTLQYDELNRLAVLNNGWGGYTYDAAGNRLSKGFGSNVTSYTYTAATKRLESATAGSSTTTYQYNPDGDLTGVNNGSRTYAYDKFHQVTQYHVNGAPVADYAYDGDGMRITKVSGGKTVVYHYDQGGRVLSENDGSANLIADYIYLHGKLVAKVSPATPSDPNNLAATFSCPKEITLNWTDTSSNELGFIVERKIGNGAYTQIASLGPNITTYPDTNLSTALTYTYRVKAYNQVGNSGYTNEVVSSADPSGCTLPSISVAPAAAGFGMVAVGGSGRSQILMVTNTGSMDLSINAISIGGASAGEFAVSDDGCTAQVIAPGANCTVTILFTPLSYGAMGAVAALESNDPYRPAVYVQLAGAGATETAAVPLSRSIIAGGGRQSFVVNSDGSLWGWGDNSFGRLGIGSAGNKSAPVQVGSQKDWSFISADVTALGASFSIKADASLWGWGDNTFYEIGNGAPYWTVFFPYQLGAGKDWVAVSSGGGQHTAALTSNGKMMAWGDNWYGQLGVGYIYREGYYELPLQVGSDDDVWVDVKSGPYHTLAMKADGSLWSWGLNFYGQLGIGGLTGDIDALYPSPTHVGLATDTWVSIAAGGGFSAAIKADGSLWAWGDNSFGQLGRGTSDNDPHSNPLRVGSDADKWVSVAAGGGHVLAIKSDGSLWAWGSNSTGQLGTGDLLTRDSPVRIGTPEDRWVAIATGGQHSLAVKSDGSLWSWGYNDAGQIGNGTYDVVAVPTKVILGKVTINSGAYNTNNQAVMLDIYATANVLSDVGNITEMKLSNDGSTWSEPESYPSDKSWSLAPGDGTKIVYVKFKDTTSAWSPAYSDTIILDTTAPSGNIVINSGDAITSSTAVTLSLNASDGQGIVSIQLRNEGEAWLEPEAYPTGGLRDWNLPAGYGEKRVFVKFKDSAGNWSAEYSDTIILLNSDLSPIAGTITINDDAAFTNSTAVTLQLSVSDPTGVLQMLFSNDGGVTWSDPEQYSSLKDWLLTSSDGEKTVLVKFIDDNWRMTIAFGDSIILDTTPSLGMGFTLISSGKSHTMMLRSDGTLWAVGENGSGQLGDGTTTNRNFPVQINVVGETDTHWLAVAAGWQHTLAIKADDRTLWAWGYDGNGQLGDGGTRSNRPAPYKIHNGQWTAVAAGMSHSMAVDINGALYTWGDDTYEQLGNGMSGASDTIPSNPTIVSGCIAVAAGYHHSLALAADGLYSWGRNDYGQLGQTGDNRVPNKVPSPPGSIWSRIAAGGNHSLALDSNGKLYAWGYNAFGQIGNDSVSNQNAPTLVVQADTDTWTRIAAGGAHSLAIHSNGKLYAWGYNDFKQVSGSVIGNQRKPIEISADTDWKEVAGGQYQSTALKADGTFWAWGDNTYGITNRVEPYRIGADQWITVAVGSYHSVGIKSTDGSLWAWGYNNNGQLGDGTLTNRSLPVSVDTSLTGAASWTAVSAGSYHSLAIGSNGTLWAWGDNNFGQLGDGTTIDKKKPVQVGVVQGVMMPELAGKTWVSVAAGIHHSVALTTDGELYTWGNNNFWQLGVDSPSQRSTPGRVDAGAGHRWIKITAEGYYTLAIRDDSTLWAWGNNANGQLGIGSTASRVSTPQLVGLPTCSMAAAGQTHVLAMDTNGALWAWGANGYYQLGDGMNTQRNSPVAITGLPGGRVWTSLTAGQGVSFALTSTGELYGWGYNGYGQLGDGSIADKDTPVQIGTSTTWSSVSTKFAHTMALRPDGTLWSWGYNAYGQLGDGAPIDRTSPRQVETIIVINSGEWSTNDTSVTLTIAAGNAADIAAMQFSNDGETWAPAENYAPTRTDAWDITNPAYGGSAGDVKTVFVRFQDAAGNWSSAFSDTIMLDAAGQ